MSVFSSFSFTQNAKGICESQLFLSGATTSISIANTPYYRLLQNYDGTPLQYGYYSWFIGGGGSNATFVPGTAPDGKNYAVYKTNTNIIDPDTPDYIICIVFRTPPFNTYEGIGYSQLVFGNYNSRFASGETRSGRYLTAAYEEWNSNWYPRISQNAGPGGGVFRLKYPGICP